MEDHWRCTIGPGAALTSHNEEKAIDQFTGPTPALREALTGTDSNTTPAQDAVSREPPPHNRTSG
ncbi:hypothetical protein GCM10010493_59110 [Streptomyces lavendulae subsp. grasserius]